MKRLTLDEAIGQTLLAKTEIGEDTLLRFSGGIVTLCTHYESYIIMDYTDGEYPLDKLHRYSDDALDELHIKGFIDGHQKFTAVTLREQHRKNWEADKEANLRRQYEELKAKFEPS